MLLNADLFSQDVLALHPVSDLNSEGNELKKMNIEIKSKMIRTLHGIREILVEC